jgi:uncharacterized Tic20 family protein
MEVEYMLSSLLACIVMLLMYAIFTLGGGYLIAWLISRNDKEKDKDVMFFLIGTCAYLVVSALFVLVVVTTALGSR